MAAHENFYQSTKLFFYTLRAFGLAPYDFDTKTSKIQMKTKNYLILVTSIVIAVLCSWASLHNLFCEGYVTGIQSVLLDRIWQSTFIVESLAIVCVIVFNYLKRQNIENFLKLIEKFDRTLARLSWEGKPGMMNKCNILMAVFWGSVTVLLTFYTTSAFLVFEDDLSPWMSCFKLNVFQLTNSFHLLVAIQFILSVYCIQTRLKVLTENMR
jgi:hypothetical protein